MGVRCQFRVQIPDYDHGISGSTSTQQVHVLMMHNTIEHFLSRISFASSPLIIFGHHHRHATAATQHLRCRCCRQRLRRRMRCRHRTTHRRCRRRRQRSCRRIAGLVLDDGQGAVSRYLRAFHSTSHTTALPYLTFFSFLSSILFSHVVDAGHPSLFFVIVLAMFCDR